MQSISGFKWMMVTLFAGGMLNGPLTASPLLAQDDSLHVDIPDEFSSGESVDQLRKQMENAPPMQELPRGVLVVLAIVGLFVLVLQIWLLVSNYTAAASIPMEFRQVNPILVLLFLIPCLQWVMYFVVWIGIANGFKRYFESQNRTEFGDCGSGLALAAALCMILFYPVGLVLWIIATFRFNALKKEIGSGGEP